MLHKKGYVKLENYFYDGTKIESASGRYTFVWKKAIQKNDKKLDEKLRSYIKLAEQVWEAENSDYGDKDLEELGGKEGYTSADVKELADILKQRLRTLTNEEDKKKLKTGLKTIEKDILPRKKKYEKAKKICGKRRPKARQLFKNSSRCGLHADERRPYGKRAAQTGIQYTNRNRKRLCNRL
jgi:uncharacterized protein YcbK (DUF882 family)